MKKLIGFIVILAMVLSVLGCDAVSAPTDPTTTTNSGTLQTGPSQPVTESVPEETLPTFMYDPVTYKADRTIPETGLNAQVQYLPETVENPDNLPVLKWVCIANKKQTWTEDAVHELNKMLADRSMPYRVQFVMLTGDVNLSYEWFNRPEAQELLKDADLIWAWMTPENQQQYLMPITEYVTGDAQPTLKNAVVHELNWIGTTVDGEIYGIQSYPITTHSHGWRMKPEVLAKYGLTEADFDRDYWEMDAVFEKIYKANGNQPFLFSRDSGYIVNKLGNPGVLEVLPNALYPVIMYSQQGIGLSFGIDSSSGAPQVVNKLATDTARRIQEAIIRYKNAGYITPEEKNVQIYYDSLTGTQKFLYRGMICIPVTDAVFDSSYNCYQMSGVAAVSQRKEAAVSLLNLIAEDEEFRHQLLFGKEGRDYTLTDGKYAAVKGDDGAYYNMEFLSMHSAFDRVKENTDTPIKYEGKTKLETYLECMDSVSVCYYPIVFDYSNLEAEVEEYAKLYGDYCMYLTNTEVSKDENGQELPYKKARKKIDGVMHEKHIPIMNSELYGEMLQALSDAGGEKIIAELQRQLDEWLAKNPDWQPIGD